METADLIERLGSDARPVRPLPSPFQRATMLLSLLAILGAASVALWGDVAGLLARYAGDEALMMAESGSMLATGVLAVLGAFMLSVPGRSRRWLLAPLPPFAIWIAASGVGCYQEMSRLGPSGWALGHGGDCLTFIIGASLLIGTPLVWRLSRARPIDPLPVALLGGLGSAALAAVLLQFFHPFGLTVIDLAIHFGAVLIVVAVSTLLRRRALAAG